MAQQKKGLITRILEGKEKSEEYARSTLPTNRWQLFWDIFKGNFGKIVKVNLLMLLFFIPMIIVIIFRMLMAESNGVLYPFSANLGIGYPAAPMQPALAESLTLSNNFVLYIGLAVSSFLSAIGLAGGMYVIRNMVWTEGIFVANDFWRGIKLNYKNALQACLLFTITLLVCGSLINLVDFTIKAQTLSSGQLVWMRIGQVLSYVFIVLSAMLSFWMIALGVNYKFSFFQMFRNAFLLAIGTFPQTIFFGVLALLPFALFLLSGSLFTVIAIVLLLLFSLAYALLVWLDFGQWVFDKYLNPKIEGAKVGRGIYNKDGTSTLTGNNDSGASKEYERTLLAYGRSKLVARPIKPIDDSLQVYELPSSFTREDLQRLRESKQSIIDDSETYAQEHQNDIRYVEYNKKFDERERALQTSVGKNGKKKKHKPPKMLGE